MGETNNRVSPTYSSKRQNALVGIIFISIAIIVAVNLPSATFDPSSHIFIFIIGVVGIWRYSWWFIHLFRSIIYRNYTFPSIKRNALSNNYKPTELFVLVTSYRIEPFVTYSVYSSILKNCIEANISTTIYASVSDATDVDVLTNILDEIKPPDWIKIRYMYQKGDGKRSAMTEILRSISRTNPDNNHLIVFMDGDIYLTESTISNSIKYFHDHNLGALTVNNRAIVDGGPATREWYDLRYAQRNLLMCSMALSERVLVLTGRYSVIRGDLATDRSFIDQIENDYVDHWRFGTFRFLSGDDKSTWFWLLRRGWKMLYVPDIEVRGFEKLPDPERFISSSTRLMRRWYGNMIRNNGRAIALGPRPMGLFTWWCLVDQRLSTWTGLYGITVAIMLSIFFMPSFILFWIFWVMMTRLIASIIIGIQHGRMSFYWPILLYYGQVVGAAIKGYVSFRQNQQAWTRQGISTNISPASWRARWPGRLSLAFHCCGLITFVYIILIILQVLPHPLDRTAMTSLTMAEAIETSSDDWWIAPIINRTGPGVSIDVPEGTLRIGQGTLEAASSRGTATFVGRGPNSIVEISGAISESVSQSGDELESQYCGESTRVCRIEFGDNGVFAVTNATLTSEHDPTGDQR